MRRQRDPLPQGPLGEAERPGTVRLRACSRSRLPFSTDSPGHDPRGDVGEPHEEVPSAGRSTRISTSFGLTSACTPRSSVALPAFASSYPLDRAKGASDAFGALTFASASRSSEYFTSAAVAFRPLWNTRSSRSTKR